jgi:hypothetical protein
MNRASAGRPTASEGFEPLEVLAFPFRVSNLLVLILFTLALSWVEFSIRILGVDGLIITIMLFYVSCLLFFGYLFVILDFTSRGHQQPPLLSASLLQSAKGPLFKECLLVSTLLALIYLIDQPYWQLTISISMLILLPVATSLLVVYDSLIAALNPLNWFEVIRHIKMGPRLVQYLLLSTALAMSCWLVVSQHWGWGNPLKLWVCLASFMLVFRCFGALLHDNADALGLDVNFSVAHSAAQAYAAQDKDVADFLFGLHKLASSTRLTEAAVQLAGRLKAEKYRREGYYFDVLAQWENKDLAVRAGVGYVDRLVAAGEMARAWTVLAFCFAADKGRVETGRSATVFMLAQSPRQIEQNIILWHLLQNFEKDFPNHPRTGEALLLAAKVALLDMHDRAGARACLARIRGVAPECVESAEFADLGRQIRSQGRHESGNSQ